MKTDGMKAIIKYERMKLRKDRQREEKGQENFPVRTLRAVCACGRTRERLADRKAFLRAAGGFFRVCIHSRQIDGNGFE